MRIARSSRVSSLPLVVLLASCGGGGPGVRGPEAIELFARYSGAWALDASASENVPAPGQRGTRPTRGSDGVRDPFGGIDGRAPGGGGRGGIGSPGAFGGRGGVGPPGGGRFNPDAVEATMALARLRPRRVELQLTDSTFTANYERGGRVVAPMNGDEVDQVPAQWPTKVKLEWDARIPRLRWSVDGGGKVTDRYELVADDRLLLTRVFNAGFGGDIEVRFVFDREGGG